MNKLIRLIGSLGSLPKVLVCILPRWQEPEDTFKTPTYLIGGSDSSHTRQGGINITNIIVAMGLKLLGIKNKAMNRENILSIPIFEGISIKEKAPLFSIFTVFSIPKVLIKP